MSFLADLRQQSSDEKSHVLIYLLNIDPYSKLAQLQLFLCDQRQSICSDNGKAYFLQQQHLSHPPEFLDQSDVDILRELVQQDSQWNQSASGYLNFEKPWNILLKLLDSQRLYYQHPSQNWLALSSGDEKRVSLKWEINTIGDQYLCWQTESDENQLFYTDAEDFTQFYIIHQSEHTLSQVKQELEPKQQELVCKHRKIAAYEVDYFLLKNQEQWRDLSLPLPSTLEEVSTDAQLIPILNCMTVHAPSETYSQRDELHLSFGLQAENFCINLSECSDTEVWDGNTLTTLNYNKQTLKELHASITEKLSDFSARQQVGEELPSAWYSRSFEQWQWLFMEARESLEQANIHFNIMPNFRQHYVTADKWDVSLVENQDDSVNIDIDLTVGNKKLSLKYLLDQLHQLNEKTISKTHQQFKLEDGRILLIPIGQFNGIMEELADLLQQSHNNGFTLSKYEYHRLAGLHQHLPEEANWHGDKEKLNNAIELHESPLFLENSLDNVKAELRPYQWLGVCWMQHITQRHINGLLADDMGLGKTLQTLAHLSFEHQHGRLKNPALIIVPTSLLYNWAREVEKFTPHLKHKVIHGSQRHQWWDSIDQYDIVISSYPLISNDLERWQTQNISWIILDEAQTIKNPRTRVSQAVREIPCEKRMCLSGTPVENHLGELWSILDFLMPGCLGTAKHFRNHFQKTIENDGNHHRFQVLLDRIAPFMLRRSKDQIADDLPPKTEIIQTIALEEDQAALYQQLKTNTWNDMQSQLEKKESPQQGHVIVLNALMKLRQACCDPELLGESDISSAKRRHCIEMLEELESENRSILVFSQFTSMLQLLAKSLEEIDIPYLMLTGQTKNRQKLVDRFQNGDAPVFLISLKAGGTGLNLTRADTIIHYDPWWNQAAEQQATDRAHRIGQEKPVFVYKLIAEKTIEEKIAQMQQRKMALSQHVNQQAQLSGETFALGLEEMLNLWQDENAN